MLCPNCRKPLDHDHIGGGLRAGAPQPVRYCDSCNLVVIGRHLELVVDNNRREIAIHNDQRRRDLA